MSDYPRDESMPLFAPISAPAADSVRLTGQNLKIFEALKRGPQFNTELALISLKYTSRLSDIRKAIAPTGGEIICERIEGGLTRYTLMQR